jgi:serine/threonine protein kinase
MVDNFTPRHLLAHGDRSRLILCATGDDQPALLKATRMRASDAKRGDGVATAVERSTSSALERLQSEVALTASLGGPFIVVTHGWLVAPRELYLQLEYLPGGDLGALLGRSGPLGPAAARFYVGCAALALEAMHSQHVAHRDVKPENICVCADGYAKVVDLGFATRLPDDGRAHSLLGTPEYLAPEIFLAEGHGVEADVWALGATLHTLLLDAHPFGGPTPQHVYSEALKGEVFFPQNLLSPPTKQLISAMLSREPAARPTAGALWTLAFFSAGAFLGAQQPLEAEALRQRTAQPPFVPRLRSPFDVRHFERGDADDDSDESGDDGEAPTLALAGGAEADARELRFQAPERACSIEELERAAHISD